jgi:hypothetical protein
MSNHSHRIRILVYIVIVNYIIHNEQKFCFVLSIDYRKKKVQARKKEEEMRQCYEK